MTEFSPLETLQQAGVPIDTMGEEQRRVLDSLSRDEVNTLIAVQRRLEVAGDDTTGHAAGRQDDGYVFF